MAILPYKVTLAAPSLQELEDPRQWCLQMWPYTHGATWSNGWVTKSPFLRTRTYGCTWWFQREEDRLAFLLAWGHLEQKPENFGGGFRTSIFLSNSVQGS